VKREEIGVMGIVRAPLVVGNVRDTAAVAKAFKGVTYVISALGSNSQRDPENKPERTA